MRLRKEFIMEALQVFLLATCSLMTLGYAIYLTEKLRKQMNEEAEGEYL